MFKMQFMTITLSLFMVIVVQGYDEKFDKIDINKILNDEALLASYINCFLDNGPCTAEYAPDYKAILPEILATACAKCTKIQRENFRKVLKEIYANRIEVLVAIQKKYDPKGEYEHNIKKLISDDS